MKIGNKLILSYLAACVVPLVITCLTIYAVSARSLQDSAYELASIISSQIGSDIDGFIDEYDRVTKTVLVDNDVLYELDGAKDSTVLEKIEHQLNMRRIMLRLVTLKPDIINICFVTDGQELFQYNPEGNHIDKAALVAQTWLSTMRDSAEILMISAVHDRAYYDRNQDGIAFTVSRRILNNSGAYVGMLLIDLEPTSLFQLSDAVLLARNQYNMKISITDSNGGILYDSDVASGRITWKDAKQEGSLLLYEKNLDDYIILTEGTQRAGLNVNVVIPKANLLFAMNNIGQVTILAIVFCIAVVVATSIFFSRMITKPMGMLQESMLRLEKGEYTELAPMNTGDEISVLVSSYNHMVSTIKTLIEDVFMAEIKQKNARYLALKTQINPHMLYNTLESIRLKALVQGADDAAEMIKILARMFRMTLTASPKQHRIADEVAYARMYIQLQDMRYPGAAQLNVALEESILQSPIVSMILQPIIENSIKHGARGRGFVLHIAIEGEMADGSILIRVRDDGGGMPLERVREINARIGEAEADRARLEPADEDEGTGIGLINIAERLALYYADASSLRVLEGEGRGTTVEMRIPVEQERKCEDGIPCADRR